MCHCPWISSKGCFASRGFTLLEMMISLVILAIALTSVFKLQSMSVVLADRAKFETTAPLLAQMKMAELMIADKDDLYSGSGDFGDEFPDYGWQTQVDEVDSEMLDDTGKRLRRIALIITWGEDVLTYGLWTHRFLEPEK